MLSYITPPPPESFLLPCCFTEAEDTRLFMSSEVSYMSRGFQLHETRTNTREIPDTALKVELQTALFLPGIERRR